jgi:dihydroorotase
MTAETPETTKTFDLVLKGGRVLDPANAIDGLLDVGIAGGKIARLAPSIASDEAIQTLDVSGLFVTPGILDIHTHVYLFRTSAKSYVEGVNADAHMLSAGVTTTVDAGTAGWKTFWDFKEAIIDRAKVRILAFLNIASNGMMDDLSEQTPADMVPGLVASMVQAYPDILVGVKTAHYWTSKPWDEMHPPWASVERAVQAGELCGKPVMVDFWPRPPERPYPDLILNKLRPGDIHTHVFAQQFPIVSAEGKANDFLFAARQRGVRFDLGHGAGSFWFRNAVPALRYGFPPDTISTDLHMGNINGPVSSMLNTMSKCLCMGMPLEEVIDRSTRLPAQLIGRPELGTLSLGAGADVAVFKLLEGAFGYTDCGKAKITGSQKLECQLTLRDGQIVYDPNGMSMPRWEQAPAAYWKMPELQSL